MARQSPDRRNAEDPDANHNGEDELGDLDVLDDDAEGIESDDSADDGVESERADETARDEATDSFWAELRIDPVEIALPTGIGYTLRAYRARSAVQLPEVERPEDEDDPFAASAARRRQAAEDAVEGEEFDFGESDEDDEQDGADRVRAGRKGRHRGDDEGSDDEDLDRDDLDEADDVLDDDALEEGAAEEAEVEAEEDEVEAEEAEVEAEEDEAEEDEAADEEVPIFLGQDGRLLLFRTPEALVEFVGSGAEHNLTQLDTWSDLVARIRPEHVIATDEDSYELDLVVENLRGGHDTWDAELLISAGEIARDLAYALRVNQIQAALAPGSPLDDLDEALRGTVSGGIGAFLARRRLRKIGAQQATLGWRTIIGKISGLADWRE